MRRNQRQETTFPVDLYHESSLLSLISHCGPAPPPPPPARPRCEAGPVRNQTQTAAVLVQIFWKGLLFVFEFGVFTVLTFGVCWYQRTVKPAPMEPMAPLPPPSLHEVQSAIKHKDPPSFQQICTRNVVPSSLSLKGTCMSPIVLRTPRATSGTAIGHATTSRRPKIKHWERQPQYGARNAVSRIFTSLGWDLCGSTH